MGCNKTLTNVCECNIKMVHNISRLTKNIFELFVYVKKRNSFVGIDDTTYNKFT